MSAELKTIFFDSHDFEKEVFEKINGEFNLQIDYVPHRLDQKTAGLARGYVVVCAFANDKLDRPCLEVLKAAGVRLIALRSAGYNHVDLKAAAEFELKVCRVPAYSPHAVAEYAVALLLCLNRKIHRSYQRVREQNFSLDGLTGFDLHGKTVGVVGTGKIGRIFAHIMTAFGCKVLACDKKPDGDLWRNPMVTYTDFETLCRQSDVISLHVPLTSDTLHLLNERSLQWMKPGVFIINTGRGALIEAKALVNELKSGKIGAAALDVYEEEENIFFHDLSSQVIQDDVLARLLTFPNVLMTSHQAFLTIEALRGIAQTTLESIDEFLKQGSISTFKQISYPSPPIACPVVASGLRGYK